MATASVSSLRIGAALAISSTQQKRCTEPVPVLKLSSHIVTELRVRENWCPLALYHSRCLSEQRIPFLLAELLMLQATMWSLRWSLLISSFTFLWILVARRSIGFKDASFAPRQKDFPSLQTAPSSSYILHVCCAAKQETVTKVCDIVKKQLALSDDASITPDSKFSTLGADSLDTVEIVMALEEEFQISVEEESSENITTVQEAADMIERLMEKK